MTECEICWETEMEIKKGLMDRISRQQERIDKAIELINRSAGYKGICTQQETDTFSKLLNILQGSDKE